jgi:hypothetical protein
VDSYKSSIHTINQVHPLVKGGSWMTAVKGLRLPYILSDAGQEILPVFSSEEAAQDSPWQRQTERSKT